MNAGRRYGRFLAIGALLAASMTAPVAAQASGPPARAAGSTTAVVQAAGTTAPASVTIAGSLQSELGCPGDWQPECATTHLADNADGVWRSEFALPTGDFEYKAALDDSWDENYGANATLNGANLALSLAEPTAVKFFYDQETHWVTDNVNAAIATAAGSFQSELGCSGDWQPACLRSWLQDVDGDGTYTYSTDALPAGNYEFKVTRDEAWDVSYGAGGGADNIAFTVARAGDMVTISYSPSDNVPSVEVPGQGTGTLPGDEDLAGQSVRQSTVARTSTS